MVEQPKHFVGPEPVNSPLKIAEKKLSISVVGLGYVGAVSCACLTDLGHRVIGVDVDEEKTRLISEGKSPIHEKDLETLLSNGVSENLLTTTTDLEQAVLDTDVVFVSVGTPTAADGGCDFRYIESAAKGIGRALAQSTNYHVIVMRCSIPPNSTMDVMVPIIERFSGRKVGQDFGVCFNPEFLREGVAVADFRTPPKTVIGASDRRAAEMVGDIFRPVDPNPIHCSIEDAELVKYVDNVWHAAKVSFANEVGRLAKSYGVDGHNVMGIFSRDHKLNISDYYLKPGFAYGGSCLPKEVRAVTHLARAKNLNLPLINSIGQSNQQHIQSAIDMVRASGAKRVAVLGLAFKSGTDDLRESPILEVMAALQADGAELKAHDNAITKTTNIAGQLAYIAHGASGLASLAKSLSEILVADVDEALRDVDAVIVTHRHPVYAAAIHKLRGVMVFDVVRLFDEPQDKSNYSGIGW